MLSTSFSKETPVSELTVGELLTVLSDYFPSFQQEPQHPETSGEKYVYGIAGLARLIGCSEPTAHRIKASGKIPYTQIGRKIMFESEAVMAAIQKKPQP